jgi:hypothetical protein
MIPGSIGREVIMSYPKYKKRNKITKVQIIPKVKIVPVDQVPINEIIVTEEIPENTVSNVLIEVPPIEVTEKITVEILSVFNVEVTDIVSEDESNVISANVEISFGNEEEVLTEIKNDGEEVCNYIHNLEDITIANTYSSPPNRETGKRSYHRRK